MTMISSRNEMTVVSTRPHKAGRRGLAEEKGGRHDRDGDSNGHARGRVRDAELVVGVWVVVVVVVKDPRMEEGKMMPRSWP